MPEIHSICHICGREFTYTINQNRTCKRQTCPECRKKEQRERQQGTYQPKGLTAAEKRELTNKVTNAISKWATDTFGEDNAFKVTNYVRALARNAVAPKGYDRHITCIYQSREEAEAVMEAAQDIMEVVDSIRYKTKHGKEE